MAIVDELNELNAQALRDIEAAAAANLGLLDSIGGSL